MMGELTTSEICRRYRISRMTLHNWHVAGMPKVAHGRWDEDECHAWIEEYRARQAEPIGDVDEAPPSLVRSHQVELLRRRIEKADLELLERRGLLVEVDTANTLIQQIALDAVQAGDAAVAAVLDPKERAIGERVFRAVRTAIAGSLERAAAAIGSGEDLEAA